ncbi:hypothetical protein SNE40_019788 [Patella caerulea]|uniref:Uncharacterized protein n=1 Tax=Patella caerulea TaxID=87958 RepID=A0AAN8J0Z3_PATCE
MVSSNPETYLKECESNPVNFDMLPEKIKLGQWKRITVAKKGKEKSVMRIVESEIEKSTFIDLVITQTTDFKDHSFRVGKQYNKIKKLKENLPQHQFIIQMDFAENYNCKSVKEIQSAYWNQTSVTLHPVVAYYRNTIGELCHTIYVVVSDELGHSSTTVHAFLDILIPEIKLIDPDVDIIHYWTDSPTSQYCNKQIFCTVANHQAVYGTKACWNYFEMGHGKGPCDGLGGMTKRMADQAVRCGKVVIRDAHDVFQWSMNSNIKGVKFLFVSSDTCKEVSKRLKARTISAVRGTFKLHVVVGMGSSTVALKETSCYCEICLNDNLCENPSWIKQDMSLIQNRST